jgi:hypothetical protein
VKRNTKTRLRTTREKQTGKKLTGSGESARRVWERLEGRSRTEGRTNETQVENCMKKGKTIS